jgi:hypothetical protein
LCPSFLPSFFPTCCCPRAPNHSLTCLTPRSSLASVPRCPLAVRMAARLRLGRNRSQP